MNYANAGRVAQLVTAATTTRVPAVDDEGRARTREYYAMALRVCQDAADHDSYRVELPQPSPRSLLLFGDAALLSGTWLPPLRLPVHDLEYEAWCDACDALLEVSLL